MHLGCLNQLFEQANAKTFILQRFGKITVMDVSTKQNMECRLLHAIILGHPWYGNWGYEFCTGSFNLTLEAYRNALESLSTEQLSVILSSSCSTQNQLHNTISLYKFLSDHPLVTIRDLFRFLANLLGWLNSKTQATTIVQKQACIKPCPWPAEYVRSCSENILKVLKATNAQQWVSWRNLTGASTSRSAGLVELRRYCLLHLNGKRTDDGRMVVMRCNDETNSLEYGLRSQAVTKGCDGFQVGQTYLPSREHVLKAIKYLYNALLNPQTMKGYRPMSTLGSAEHAATQLLNCKHLIKHYDKADDFFISSSSIQTTCEIEVVDHFVDPVCPPEILVLPATATVQHLKAEAAKAFKETYLIYKNFEPDELVNFEGIVDSTQVNLLLGSQGTAHIKGRCSGGRRRLKPYQMEQGINKWEVNCSECGANNDDGERMVACDMCGVWQHTRCVGFKDDEDVPREFICGTCRSS